MYLQKKYKGHYYLVAFIEVDDDLWQMTNNENENHPREKSDHHLLSVTTAVQAHPAVRGILFFYCLDNLPM